MTRTLPDRTDSKSDGPADEDKTTVAEDRTGDDRATEDGATEGGTAENGTGDTEVEEATETKATKEETPPAKAAKEKATRDEPATAVAAAPARAARLRAALASARSARIGVIILAVLAVAGIAGTAWFGSQSRAADNTDKAADAAVSAAREFTTTLTSVSANSIDKDFAAVLAGSTGEYRAMYAKSSDQLRQLLVDNKAQAKGTVLASGVESATTDKVVVLMFVDQTVQNVSNAQPRIDRSRIRITMTEHDGRWLAEKVELP